MVSVLYIYIYIKKIGFVCLFKYFSINHEIMERERALFCITTDDDRKDIEIPNKKGFVKISKMKLDNHLEYLDYCLLHCYVVPSISLQTFCTGI